MSSWTVVLLHVHAKLTASSRNRFQLFLCHPELLCCCMCMPNWQLLHVTDSSCFCVVLNCCAVACPVDSFFTELIPVVYCVILNCCAVACPVNSFFTELIPVVYCVLNCCAVSLACPVKATGVTVRFSGGLVASVSCRLRGSCASVRSRNSHL